MRVGWAGVGVQSLTLVISQEGGITTPEVAAAAAAAKSGAGKPASSTAGSPAASPREAAGGPSSPIGGIVGGIIGGVAAAFLLLLGAFNIWPQCQQKLTAGCMVANPPIHS